MKNHFSGSQISALSCYDLKSGALIITLRLRVHAPSSRDVGRHSFTESKSTPNVTLVKKQSEAATEVQVAQAELEAKIDPEGPSSLKALESIYQVSQNNPQGAFVWLEHFPWEMPKQALKDALIASQMRNQRLTPSIVQKLAKNGYKTQDQWTLSVAS